MKTKILNMMATSGVLKYLIVKVGYHSIILVIVKIKKFQTDSMIFNFKKREPYGDSLFTN